MADSFFGFDTSQSNLNDDEGGGGPSEDEYDALNDETFGQESDEFDWEVEHEHLAEQLESSRRHDNDIDDVANTQLEASLSQLVLDETDAPLSRSLGSSVWRNDLPFPSAPTPVLKNVCTVEELERQLRQKQMSQPQQTFGAQNYYQPRFPVILQRPPGIQAPVPLPFAPPQPMTHNMQHNQSLNKIIGQHNQMGQNNQMMPNHVNQMSQNLNQMGQNVGQFMQNANKIGQFQNNQIGQNNMMNLTQNMQNIHQMSQSNQLLQNQMGQNLSMTTNMGQLGQNVNQMNQNMTQMSQNINQMGQNMPKLGQNMSQMGQNMTQMGQNITQMGPNIPQMGQNAPQMNQNLNKMGQNMNHMTQNMNQMGQNMNQMGQNMNQMGQNMGQIGQSIPQMGQNMPQMGQNVNQMAQNMPQMGQNVNQMGQNNQMMPNGNQFGQINQFQHNMMSQPRMIVPPPGMNMPRQNFSPNMSQFNHNFRGPSVNKSDNIMGNQPMLSNNQPIHNMKPMNQTAQNASPQNKIMQNAKKIEPKQKTRIYNNSKNMPTQNLTSQNLVQIIQNTHPILQMNSGFHNANHHPMLNRNVYNNNQYNHPMLNQRLNGSFSNNMHSMNGDDEDSDSDEYAGLMTSREKQWLINIQMLQLNTGTPYIHDFYYTVFLERQANKEKEGVKEAHMANQQNHPFYSGGVKQENHTHRERHNSNRHNSTSEDNGTPRTYVPTQFENSLGKLQCGSVTAPRKIIDVEVVASESTGGRNSRAPSVASTTNPAEVPRELKRTKQLLLDIEALYLILLRVEELNDPLAISNALILKEREEKQKQLEAAQKELENEEDESNLFLKNIESVQRRPKQDSPKSESIDKRQVVNLAVNQKPAPIKNLLDENKDELVNKMFQGLLHSDRMMQMMTVRKGRTLICRFLSRVAATHARLRAAWARVLRALPAAARRDPADRPLRALAPLYASYIQNTTGWAAILESCSSLAEAFDPARTPYALTTPFTLSAVCALIEKTTLLITTPDATSNERQWSKFLKTLARALKNTSLTVARPVRPLQESKLKIHLKQLESRSTIEILQRGKTAEFTDLTKTDVTEQLVKHLC